MDFQPTTSRRWNFSLFTSVEEFASFMQKNPRILNNDLSAINSLADPFQDIQMFDEAREKIESLANSIDLGGAFQKAKLKITDNASGIFDFGLASLGLQRLVEFYSESLEQQHPKAFEEQGAVAGLVPNVLVEKNEFGQYYVDYNKQRYLLEKRQKGTTLLKRANPTMKLEMKNGMLIPENATDPSIARSLGFTSSQKKSYIEFEKVGGRTPYIDIIVPLNFLISGQGTNALRSILPAIMAAKFFERAGVQTRILAGRVVSEETTRALPYTTAASTLVQRAVIPPKNNTSKLAKGFDFNDLRIPSYYEAFPPPNTINLTVFKERGKEADYNTIGNLLVNSSGKWTSAVAGYQLWSEARSMGASNYRNTISSSGKGLWYAFPSTMVLVGRVFGKYSNFVEKNKLWGDKRGAGSFAETPFNPSPPLLTLGSWIALEEYDLDNSIKDETLLLHHHPFGYSFWMLIDRAELALSANSAKVMKRIDKRLRSEGYETDYIQEYLKELANMVFGEVEADPLLSLELLINPQAWQSIKDEAYPPNYYATPEDVRKFYDKKSKEFLRTYQDMINRMTP